MKVNLIILILFNMYLFSSCEKEINFDLNSSDPKIVIEGEISDRIERYSIRISKTVNFSDASVFPAVKGALVNIRDNEGNSENLIETSGGYYQTRRILGISGRTYTLSVTYEGKTYTSKSTMPLLVRLYGLAPIVNSFSFPRQESSDYFIVPQYIDPKGLGNNYRFIQYINSKKDKSFYITNDNSIDGLMNQRPIVNFNIKILKGDTVTIEMRCIDKNIFEYFNSLNLSVSNGPGGGITPSNPVSNIEGGALGYFSAHTIERRTIIVK